MDLEGTSKEFRPENCVMLGNRQGPQMLPVTSFQSFERIMNFEHLADGRLRCRAELRGGTRRRGQPADRAVGSRIADGSGGQTRDRMQSEGTAPDLEPFVAFGPAMEMAALMDDDDRFDREERGRSERSGPDGISHGGMR